jgi:ATP-dependent DNA helicase RecG
LTGVSLDDIMLGLSVCRNPKLAEVFYRLELIEACGTGMRKIMKAYEGGAHKPIIETTSNAFKIVLPNLNEKHFQENQPQRRSMEEEVLEFARNKGAVSRKDVEQITELKQTAAGSLLRNLVEQNLLVREGQGKNTEYVVKR